MNRTNYKKLYHRLLFFAAIVAICGLLSLQSCRSGNTKNGVVHTTDEQYNITAQPEISLDSITGAFLRLDKSRHDFGTIRIKKTPKITIEFEIDNLGKSPLVILKADVSCACMSVDYPKMPVSPGDRAKLTVTINTKNQRGVFNKPVFIKSNADNDVVLIRILGKIEK